MTGAGGSTPGASAPRPARPRRARKAAPAATRGAPRADETAEQDGRAELAGLASLGALASELAHEIRNPLVALKSFLELLPERRGDPELETRFLAVARDELRRAERLLDAMIAPRREGERPEAPGGGAELHAWLPSRLRGAEGAAQDRDVRLHPFGSTGLRIPALGQGTWTLERADRRAAVAALRAGIDAGATHLDTAEMYGDGRVEELVAEAIAGRRDEVFLVSKVLPENASRRGSVAACEASLQRLRTDRLDCYLLHWAGEHPLADTIAAFEELAAAGKIRSYGVSNFDELELAEAVRIAGPGRIACNQVLYHLGERRVEHAVVPFCEARGIAVVGYSPFGSGRFPGPRSRGGRVLGEVAAAHGATPRQVALAFLVRRPSLFAIPKASRAERSVENAAAARIALGAGEIARIEAAFPPGARRRGVPIL